MIHPETRHGNFIISIFRGWAYKNISEFNEDISSIELHNYHEDWNKLMDVVEKIESLFDGSISVNIYDERCTIEISSQYAMATDIHLPSEFYNNKGPKIKSTWLSIIEFIQWYNSQNKTK